MTKKNENRLPVWAQPVTTKIDPNVFQNCFFNARGEFSTNLETSKSKIAVAIRAERDAQAKAKAEEEARLEQERQEKLEAQRKLDAELAAARRQQEQSKQRKLEIADLERELRTTSRERDNKIKLALHNGHLFEHEKRDLLRTAAFLAKQIANIRSEIVQLRKEKK